MPEPSDAYLEKFYAKAGEQHESGAFPVMLLAWAKPFFQLCYSITQPDYFCFQALISKHFSIIPS